MVVRDESLVRWFLDHGADPNAPAGLWDVTPLSYAVSSALLSTIKLLFDHGGSTARGQLAIYAAQRSDPEAVPILRYLVDRGAAINDTWWENLQELEGFARTHLAATPLIYAVEAGNIDSVRFLLE